LLSLVPLMLIAEDQIKLVFVPLESANVVSDTLAIN